MSTATATTYSTNCKFSAEDLRLLLAESNKKNIQTISLVLPKSYDLGEVAYTLEERLGIETTTNFADVEKPSAYIQMRGGKDGKDSRPSGDSHPINFDDIIKYAN